MLTLARSVPAFCLAMLVVAAGAACGGGGSSSHDAAVGDGLVDGPPIDAPPFGIVSYGFAASTNPALAVNVSGTITGSAIAVTVPFGTDVTALKAEFTTDGNCGVEVGSTNQVTNSTANDFSAPVTYTVNDVEFTKTYIVTITMAAPTASFGTASTLAIAPSTIVSLGDFNNDGRPDLLATGATTITVAFDTTTPGATTATFPIKTTFAVGNAPAALAIADFNGDGRLDVVTATTASNAVSVFLNTTAAGATAAAFAPHADAGLGTLAPTNVAAGDLNNDGRPDVVACGATGLAIALDTTAPGATTPSFATPTPIATGATSAIALADFDGDGKLDLAIGVSSGGTSSVAVLLNKTAPGATTASFATAATFAVATTATPLALAIADFNGDGRPDIATAGAAAGTISVFLDTTAPGAATPTFATRTDFTTAATTITSLSVTDVSGDGRPDLIAAGGAAGAIALLNTAKAGATTPAFTQASSVASVTTALSVAIADLNGDGKGDLVASDPTTSNVAIAFNTTAWGHLLELGTLATFGAGTASEGIALGDLNGDGKLDAVISNYNDSTISVLFGTTAAGSSTPAFATQVTFATPVTPSTVAIADLNNDGRPDVAVSCPVASVVSVFLNTTAAGATTPTFATRVDLGTGNPGGGVSLADLNGDGKIDLVQIQSNGTTASASVFLNTTTAGATTPTFATRTDFALATTTEALVIGDINGDGLPDLVLANGSGGTGGSVLLNTTAPGAAVASFAARTDFTTCAIDGIGLADLDGDGRPDVASFCYNESDVSVLLNTTALGATTATFATHAEFTATVPNGLLVGDLDGDGLPDLAAPDRLAGTTAFLRNTTARGAATPSFASSVDLTTGFVIGPLARDLNGDGRLDLVFIGTNAGLGVMLAK